MRTVIVGPECGTTYRTGDEDEDQGEDEDGEPTPEAR